MACGKLGYDIVCFFTKAALGVMSWVCVFLYFKLFNKLSEHVILFLSLRFIGC
ncbi:unnamed protein product, partial [Brassica rapa subsp. trilocularis]